MAIVNQDSKMLQMVLVNQKHVKFKIVTIVKEIFVLLVKWDSKLLNKVNYVTKNHVMFKIVIYVKKKNVLNVVKVSNQVKLSNVNKKLVKFNIVKSVLEIDVECVKWDINMMN